MITLYQFAPAFGVNPSPFCFKIELALRLSGLEPQGLAEVEAAGA